jgi:hypothetical protein
METQDRRWALRIMANELNISKETIRQILYEGLRNREDFAKFVPYRLTDGQKQRRLTSGQGLIHTCQDSPNFIDCILSFSKAKTVLKGTGFQNAENIKYT